MSEQLKCHSALVKGLCAKLQPLTCYRGLICPYHFQVDIKLDHAYWKHLWSSFDQYPWLTLYQYSINTLLTSQLTRDQHSLTSWTTALRELTNSWLMLMSQLLLCKLVIKCWSSVNQVSIEISMKCRWLIELSMAVQKTSIKGI